MCTCIYATAAMTAAHGPVVGRRRLKAALRRARDKSGLTQQQVAEAMDWSLSKIIRIESGIIGISTNDLRALLHHYGVSDKDAVDELVGLAKVGRRKPWWSAYREKLVSPNFMTLIGLEAEASSLDIFNMNILPGLLQTQAYARAALDRMIPKPTEEELDARVAVRLRRQREVFDRPDPPRVLAVLDEAVLHRMLPLPEDTLGQLQHLIDLSERPNVTIQIVPFQAGVYHLASPFFVLSFPDDEDDVAYVESALDEALIEDPTQTNYYHQAFQSIRDLALDPESSAALVGKVMDEVR